MFSTDVQLTMIRASMTSLHVCRLVALVTSRNNSLVVFLICRVTGQAGHVITTTVYWNRWCVYWTNWLLLNGGHGCHNQHIKLHTDLGFLTVSYRWEWDDVSFCIHQAWIVWLSLQNLEVSVEITHKVRDSNIQWLVTSQTLLPCVILSLV